MHPRDRRHDGKPEPVIEVSRMARRVDTKEAVEDARQMRRRNLLAAVEHGQRHLLIW
jgi:hypothetical protein